MSNNDFYIPPTQTAPITHKPLVDARPYWMRTLFIIIGSIILLGIYSPDIYFNTDPFVLIGGWLVISLMIVYIRWVYLTSHYEVMK